jgi:hypothetical protein
MHALKSPLLHRDLKVSTTHRSRLQADDIDRKRPLNPWRQIKINGLNLQIM